MSGSKVGKSHRTPFKHFLLNALLGREAGIFSHCPNKTHARADPWHVIDMNAGDGDGELSSPGVIAKHAIYARGYGVPVRVTLIERAEATFHRLLGNVPVREDGYPLLTGGWLSRGFPCQWELFECLHLDSRLYRVPREHEHQAVFVHSDPNSLADWCLTPEVIETFTETTTMLATLGCNVGGLKRLSAEERIGWFDHVSRITDSMPNYHDAVLISLDSDPAQWAYLVRAPSKWTERVMESALGGAKRAGLRLSMGSLRQSAAEFIRLERELFLTHSERKASDGQAQG